MPFYKLLKNLSIKDRKRIVAGITRIRGQFSDIAFPKKKASESLILGSWNIRNFDDDRFNYGPRSLESIYYIAEVISKFDIIAVQEICVDLAPLQKIMSILGSQYDFILTDVTHSGLGGNKERLGFIYDTQKVKFKGVAGEIVLPDKMLISEVTNKKRQFSRTPFGAEFQAGWFRFNFSTVHIYFGSSSKNTPQYKRRVDEIRKVARYIRKEAESSDSNQILVGDFNILERGSAGFNALEKEKFTVVENRVGSNRDLTKFYDQISFLSRKNELELVNPNRAERTIQFFDSVYREDQFQTYRSSMLNSIATKLANATSDHRNATSATAKKKAKGQIDSLKKAKSTEKSLEKYYREWRTFQMSDHLPIWVEIKIDFSNQYLDYLDEYKA